MVDLAPLPSTDPRGAAFNSSLLPLLVTGIAGAALSSRVARTLRQRIGLLVCAPALTGLAVTAVARSWLDYLDGNWGADAGIIAFTVFAVSSVVAGLASVGRTAGLLCGAVLMVLIGNATAGASSAPELLPRAIAWTGRLLPPGAGFDALRGTAFFHGYGIGRDLAVLSVWSVLGCAMVVLGAVRNRWPRSPAHGAHALGTTAGSAPPGAAAPSVFAG